uniref:Uncharacterized protein n=1 Tax=Heterorhabditis bacteriophora TaxID=37862 RepID=A0A1I7WJG1_HETBA
MMTGVLKIGMKSDYTYGIVSESIFFQIFLILMMLMMMMMMMMMIQFLQFRSAIMNFNVYRKKIVYSYQFNYLTFMKISVIREAMVGINIAPPPQWNSVPNDEQLIDLIKRMTGS